MLQKVKKLLFGFLLISLLCPAQNGNPKQSLSEITQPQSVGISPERLQRLDGVFQEYVQKKILPGAVFLVARKGKLVYHKSFGISGRKGNEAMRTDHLFRIASMSKPITSVAVMLLLEEGKILLDEPLTKYIPEFKNMKVLKEFNPKDSSFTTEDAKSLITIRQLLTHTSGIGYAFMNPKVLGAIFAKNQVYEFDVKGNENTALVIKKLATMPLVHQPGEKWTYGMNTDVLGYLVEVVSGMNFGEFCEKRIFNPLGMNDTRFFYDKSAENRFADVFKDNKEGIAEKYPTDDPQYKLVSFPYEGKKAFYSGGGGMSSTAMDYLKFCQMILNKGELDGKRILSRKSVEMMCQNQIGDLFISFNSFKFGFGFDIVSPGIKSNVLSSEGSLSWGGLFNTVFWIDPKEELIAIGMTQIYPNKPDGLFDKFKNLVYQSITD